MHILVKDFMAMKHPKIYLPAMGVDKLVKVGGLKAVRKARRKIKLINYSYRTIYYVFAY